jgi:polyether ionophore transport system permease protein
MTAHAGSAPITSSAWGRIYGLGTVYAKTLRDSRLAVLIVAGLLGILFVSAAAAFGRAYGTEESRRELATLVNSLPPVMAGIYGNPFPLRIEILGGSIAWKSGGSMALIAALWSVLALGGTLAGEARRGSLEFVAATPLGMRRIALEKLFAHLTGMAIVVVVLTLSGVLSGALFATLPGDEIQFDAALGFAAWIGVVALASGSVAFALAPLIGRGAATAIAGAVLLGGYFVNGYQGAVPAFAPLANVTWWGWTAHHAPLVGQSDWLSLVPGALATIVLLAIGVEVFSRRDLGSTSHVPWPAIPTALVGLRGPMSRSFGERMPLAVSWGIGIGLFAFVLGAAAKSFTETLAQGAPEIMDIFRKLFPTIDLLGAGGFLELTSIMFGFVLAGFAAATLVNGWASDETDGRLEMLLATPLTRARWALAGGLGLYVAIGLLTAIIGLGVGLGAAITGGDVATPILGTIIIGLYAAALAGIGLAWGGVVGTGFAGEIVAAVVILTFMIDFLVPALELPDVIRQVALTSHLGQPMVGVWDWAGIAACVVIAVGGLLLGAWGIARRDVAR